MVTHTITHDHRWYQCDMQGMLHGHLEFTQELENRLILLNMLKFKYTLS